MQNCQSGRSMIEMLGVLAIVGVLSMGGLAGFSKMMTQYKINATMQQINIISAKLSALGSQVSSYGGLDNANAIKLGVVPAEALPDSGSDLRNPFDGTITIFGSNLLQNGGAQDNQAYVIQYTGLPSDACIALASTNWNNSKSSSLLGIGVGSDAASKIYQGCPGTSAVACPEGSVTQLPMDIGKARAACSCTDNCVLVAKFF